METAGNLPAELTGFVGRASELDRLVATGDRITTGDGDRRGRSRQDPARAACRAGSCRTVTATASGSPSCPRLHGPELLDHTVVEALRLTDHTSRPPREALVDHLADRDLLLVLDGFEQLATAVRRAGTRICCAGRRGCGCSRSAAGRWASPVSGCWCWSRCPSPRTRWGSSPSGPPRCCPGFAVTDGEPGSVAGAVRAARRHAAGAGTGRRPAARPVGGAGARTSRRPASGC